MRGSPDLSLPDHNGNQRSLAALARDDPLHIDTGLRLLVGRERDGDEMRTVDVARRDTASGALGEHERP